MLLRQLAAPAVHWKPDGAALPAEWLQVYPLYRYVMVLAAPGSLRVVFLSTSG